MPVDPKRLKELFLTASEMPSGAERAAFLDRECGADAELRARLEALLQAHDNSGGFLAQPVAAPGVTTDSAADEAEGEGAGGEAVGDVVGPYKLLQKLGEGGMGAVWVAEQHEPVKRRVALKLIKPGMDSAQVLRRFEQERQALALMDHTHIAKVLDAGTTPTGRPYFVMELVHGVPITRYCDELNLPIRERLGLFVPVCQAIQHAHTKGIIHGDVKPSNVLVCMQDGRPVAKVIDFGVAKAMNQRLIEETVYTEFGAVVGTLEYMAPEQAEMSPLGVDTRSDVYSLGVLLYELLTGTTPLDKRRLKQAAFLEVLRLIKEEEPPRPSTRLSESKETLASVAAHRRTEPARLTKAVRGELDWIVMRCLEKDRSRRYETASGLARDVERHLADEPVEACPPSRRYRLGKFLRRHKGPVVAAALVLLALAGGMAGTGWGLVRAERALRAEAERAEGERQAREAEAEQRRLAEERKELAEANEKKAVAERQVAEAVRTFLQRDLLRQADAREQANTLLRLGDRFEAKENPTVKELLDRAAAGLAPGKIEAKFPGQREVQAAILLTVGATYRSIGEYAQAVEFLTRASDTRREALGADHPATLAAFHNLAYAYLRAGQLPRAVELFERVRDAQVRSLGADHLGTLATLNTLASAYGEGEQLDRAVALLERVRDACTKKFGADHPNTLVVLSNLAGAYLRAGHLSRAVELFERVRDAQVRRLGPDHPDTLTTMNSLAVAYREGEHLDRAIGLLERVRDARARRLGADHPDTLTTLKSLAVAYEAAGQLDRTVALLERVRDACMKKFGADHPDTLTILNYLALAYRESGQLPRAIGLLERVRDAQVRRLGADHPKALRALYNLALAYRAAGNLDRAVELLERVREAQMKKLGADHPHTLDTLDNLSAAYQEGGQLDRAVRLCTEALKRREARLGADHPSTLKSVKNLAGAYLAAGDRDRALPLFKQALKRMTARLGPDHPDTLRSMSGLAASYRAIGQPGKALPLYEETLKRTTAILGPDHPVTLTCMRNLAEGYGDVGKPDKALPLLEETLKRAKAKLGGNHPDTFKIMNSLASTYLRAGKVDRGLPLAEQALEGRTAALGPDHPDTLISMNNLAGAFWAAQRLDRSVPLFEGLLPRQEKKLGRDHPTTLMTVANLGVNYKDAGRLTEALPLLEEAYRAAKKHPTLRFAGPALLDAYRKAGKTAEMAHLSEELLTDARRQLHPGSPQLAQQLASLCLPRLEGGQFAEAEPLLRECLAIREKTQPDAWTTFNTQSMLGGALLGQKKYPEAEPLLLAGYEGMKQRQDKIPPQGKARLAEAAERLVRLYEAWGKPEQAKAWRDKLPPPDKPKPRREKGSGKGKAAGAGETIWLIGPGRFSSRPAATRRKEDS